MERRAILESMQRVLEDQLTYRQRTALLAEMKGMPQDEIARHLGSNRNAIYKLTHDARKKLKQGLEAAGYSSADVVTTISN
jgi:RNA polymerase sigma-70 factor (ECF subfamily)